MRENQTEQEGRGPSDAANALLSILRELFGLPEINLEDNFFDIGGNSFLVIEAIALLAERYKIAVSARKFILKPVIADIAAACRHMADSATN